VTLPDGSTQTAYVTDDGHNVYEQGISTISQRDESASESDSSCAGTRRSAAPEKLRDLP